MPSRKTLRSRRGLQFYTTGKPWRKLGTRTLIELGEVRLYEDKLVSKTGVRNNHLRLALHDFSIIVPLLANKRLVFEWNYRHVTGGWELELPAGLMEKSESPLDCAKRELREETGYTASSWKAAGWVHTLPGITGQKAYVHLARNLKPGPSKREPSEMMRVEKLSIREAYRMLRAGLIVHAPTVVGLSLVQKQLDRPENSR